MLTARIVAANPRELLIEARYTNTRDGVVFVVDTLHGTGTARHTPAPERAYVMRWPAGVRVGKFLMQVPEGTDIAAPEVPYAVPVQPGAAHVTRMRLPLPLVPSIPYLRPATLPPDRPVAVTSLVVVLGTFDASRFAPNAPVMTPSPTMGANLFRVHYGWGLELQEFATQGIEIPTPGIPALF